MSNNLDIIFNSINNVEQLILAVNLQPILMKARNEHITDAAKAAVEVAAVEASAEEKRIQLLKKEDQEKEKRFVESESESNKYRERYKERRRERVNII